MFSVKKDKAAATSVVVVGGVSKEGPALAAGEEELGQENKLDVAMSKEEKVREEEKDSSFQPTMTTAKTLLIKIGSYSTHVPQTTSVITSRLLPT